MPVDESALGLPAPCLRPVAAFYAGYRQRGMEPGSHRGLPSGYLTLVVTLETPLNVTAMPTSGGAPARFEALLAGLHTGPVSIEHAGSQDGIYVALHPRGARMLFGLRPAELGETMVDLEAVLGPRVDELRERLVSAASWSARFAVVDDVLAGALVEHHDGVAAAYRAWEQLAVSGGDLAIGGLAADLGWSRRHLGALFRNEFGVAPKVAARILRFARSRSLLKHSRSAGLAAVAAAAGYADQAHLTREWQALAGRAPTTWMAEERAGSCSGRPAATSATPRSSVALHSCSSSWSTTWRRTTGGHATRVPRS